MKKQIEISVQPKYSFDKEFLKGIAAEKLKINAGEISSVALLKRSLDARKKNPFYRILADVYINQFPEEEKLIQYLPVKSERKVIVVGFGPAGMFASLKLIELGIKPIVIERGKDVQERRKDLKNIQQYGIVNPDSNYCFGEGGAGTYSDGKLYTRSTKRGDVNKILKILIQHGANPDITVDSHPHIGSNRLPKIVQAIRQTILDCGGEIHFESRVTQFIIVDKKMKGVITNNEKEFIGESVILCTGHSSRDIYYLLDKQNVKLEAKPFAMGVRIEHPQKLINEIQYHHPESMEYLPAASYNLACQINNKGVFSFCMCPGGLVVPASTAPGELVLNGMSLSKRDSAFANSGFVVEINETDWSKYTEHNIFAGLEYQKGIEKIAFEAGGGTQAAPAQRITDFLKKKLSSSLPDSSYIPGVVSAPLHEILPFNISSSLSKALHIFNNKMHGYITEEAQILAAETRTSSPIRIPRNRETGMHIEVEGLFPCGEGAGYAGGIVSAAIDGENAADSIAKFISH